MPVEGDFEMSCWSFLEIIWFHFWEAVHMEKWCSQTKDMLDWFFLMSLLLRSRKNWRIREGKCQIYLVYNKETLLFYCCSSYTSSQTSPSTMRKCFKKIVYKNVSCFLQSYLLVLCRCQTTNYSLKFLTYVKVGLL